MSRVVLITISLVAIFVWACHSVFAAAPPPERSRPNVLLLLTDQQTLRAMSAYGNRYLHTPHMDSLAAAGVRFGISYCTSPVCGPSRSSIVTGCMPHETGVDLNGQTPDPAIPNLGQIFRDAGYETAWTGKWHLPGSYPRPPDGTIPGFECLHVPEGTKFMLGDQTDAAVTDQAVAFLRKKHDRPWLLAVSLHNPHDICWWVREKPVKPANLDLFPPLPDNFAIAPDESEFMTDCRKPKTYGVEQQFTAEWDEVQWRAYLYSYYRLTEQVDRLVGRILDVLREKGLEKDTLIVFTSDHGEGAAGHQLIVKLTPYDGAAAVPLVIAWNGRIPSGREDQTHPVSSIDIVPTVCDYAGVTLTKPLTGVSLRPIIEDPEAPGRGYAVCELSPFRTQPHRKARVLRTTQYKYIAFTDGERPEMLFDMQDDPGESRNLAGQSAHRGELLHHRKLLVEWVERTKDHFVAPWMTTTEKENTP